MNCSKSEQVNKLTNTIDTVTIVTHQAKATTVYMTNLLRKP